MQIKKLSKKVILIAIAFAAFIGSTAYTRITSRYDRTGNDSAEFGRPVGLFSSVYVHHSRYNVDDSKIGIYRSFVFRKHKPFCSVVDYIDEADNQPLDGKVDKIRRFNLLGTSFLHRGKHYESHKPEFDKADETIGRAEEKYKNFLEFQYNNP